MSFDELESIEIVESDIIDNTIEVGSGCEWRGTGKEPQWDNLKCTKVYDHILRHHGSRLKPSQIMGRMASMNRDQGQWLKDNDIILAEQVTPKYSGRYIIDFKRPVGRVYHRDGNITENVTRINLKRNPDGTLRYGYPVTETYILRREI
ncbi:MAG: hypothetical protein F6K10_00430 [Moorea sp. SIO2B7]|nr:hypothetical protein [Moorena sp. SIO2B7]